MTVRNMGGAICGFDMMGGGVPGEAKTLHCFRREAQVEKGKEHFFESCSLTLITWPGPILHRWK
jgi:hypothetical protein